MPMECSSSQKKVCLKNSDRLTGLPVELLHTIYQFLSIKDIVRTSILSTDWRERWMYIPDLVFDASSILVKGQRTIEYVDCVNQVLFLHNANVSRFEITDYPTRGSPYFDKWIRILGRKNVKELFLHFLPGFRYRLPSCLFACQNLRILRLIGCNLSLPPSVKGFCNLIELYLARVQITEETIASLIFNSPVERFCLDSSYGFRSINLCAPTLRIFSISGPCESINFENTPLLEVMDLQLEPPPHPSQVNRRIHKLEDVIGDGINVQQIYALKYFMEILAVCKVPKRNHSNEQFIALDEGESSVARIRRREDIFRGLEIVDLHQFKGSRAEMDMIGFILLNAAVLETVSVKWDVSCIEDHQRKALVLKNLIKFNKTSPKAQVLFANPSL